MIKFIFFIFTFFVLGCSNISKEVTKKSQSISTTIVEVPNSNEFIVRYSGDKLAFGTYTRNLAIFKTTTQRARQYCRNKGFESVGNISNGQPYEWTEEKDGFYFYCQKSKEQKEESDQLNADIKAIDKAGELCTNIGYTPNTDPYRGCIVELLKAEKSTTSVTVNQTKDYSEMINRGICMTTGNCDITGQPIIRQSQNTITNARCRVTGTGAWKTIQCF